MSFDQILLPRNRFKKLISQIRLLDSALLYTEIQPPFQHHAYLVNSIQVDEENNIWFLLHKDLFTFLQTGKALPVQLNFFKKGMPYWVNVTGNASFLNDAALTQHINLQPKPEESIAVKVTIEFAKQINMAN